MNPNGPQPPRAVRLVLRYGGGAFEVASSREMRKVVPPTDELNPPHDQAGAWLVIEDAAGRPLYRRNLLHPLLSVRETFEPLKAIVSTLTRTEFEVTVPLPAGAAAIKLFVSPIGPERQMDRAREVLAININTLGGGGRN